MLQCGTDKQTSEDRATQPIDAGGWVSQKSYDSCEYGDSVNLKISLI